ncbi:uncharacterized protein LOC128929796 [Callithrix jacchus]
MDSMSSVPSVSAEASETQRENALETQGLQAEKGMRWEGGRKEETVRGSSKVCPRAGSMEPSLQVETLRRHHQSPQVLRRQPVNPLHLDSSQMKQEKSRISVVKKEKWCWREYPEEEPAGFKAGRSLRPSWGNIEYEDCKMDCAGMPRLWSCGGGVSPHPFCDLATGFSTTLGRLFLIPQPC